MDARLGFVDFGRAVAGLRRVQTPANAEMALDGLARLQAVTTCAWVVNEYGTLDSESLPDGSQLQAALIGDSGVLEIEQAAFGLLPFPVLDLEEALLNLEEGERLNLCIDPQGIPDGYDDLDYLMSSPDNWSDTPLLVMAKYLDMLAGEDYWELAREEKFHVWPDPPLSTGREVERFRVRSFRNSLKRLYPNLPGVQIAFAIAASSTGNIFLDWDLEAAYTNGWPFTVENIRELDAIWAKAEVLLAEYQAAEAAADAEMLAEIVEAWDRACVFAKRNPRPRALVDLWMEPELDQEAGEPVEWGDDDD